MSSNSITVASRGYESNLPPAVSFLKESRGGKDPRERRSSIFTQLLQTSHEKLKEETDIYRAYEFVTGRVVETGTSSKVSSFLEFEKTFLEFNEKRYSLQNFYKKIKEKKECTFKYRSTHLRGIAFKRVEKRKKKKEKGSKNSLTLLRSLR